MIRFFFIRIILLFLATFICINVNADESEGKIRAANIWIDYGELGKALKLLKEAQSYEDVSQSKINTSLGRIYFKLGKYEKSQELYESAIFSTSSDDALGYLGLAQAYLESGNLTRSKMYASTVIKGKEKIVEANLVLSEIDARSGFREKADARLKELSIKRPNDEQVVIAFSKFLFTYDKRVNAITKLQEFISNHPDAANAIEYLSKLKEFMGFKQESISIGFKAADIYEKRGEILRAKILREILKTKEGPINIIEDTENNQVEQRIDTDDEKKIEEKVTKQKENKRQSQEEKGIISKNNGAAEDKNTAGKIEKDLADKTNDVEVQKEVEEPVEISSTIDEIIISKHLQIKNLRRWWNNIRGNPNDIRNLPFAGKQVITGSGFILDSGKYVITNYHVIVDANIVAVRNGKGIIRGGKKIFFDEKNDLAVIELNDAFSKNSVLSLNNFENPLTGTDALVIGFPLTDVFGWQHPSITQGLVTKSTGLVDNPNHILISSKMNLGNSGGPVVDEKGCLIGIAVAKLDKSLIYEKEGFIPEDINIAIKPSVAAKMFEGINNLKCKATKKIERTELYQLMLSKVVNVVSSKN